MLDVNRIDDRYYIIATSSTIDPQRLVLKSGDTFGVFDRYGDILSLGEKEQGIYHQSTRFLSWYELRVNGSRPLFLSSTVDADDILLSVDFTNPDILPLESALAMKRDSIHIMRQRTILDAQCCEYLRFKNFGLEKIEFSLELLFDADFADIFEVRGIKRHQKGELAPPVYRDGELILAYTGLDSTTRSLSLLFSREPDLVEGKKAQFTISLVPGGVVSLNWSFIFIVGEHRPTRLSFQEAVQAGRKATKKFASGCATIHSSNDLFNASFDRALSDLKMLLTETESGPYPYGGIPWFCSAFGRDGLITALQFLWLKPKLAEGVLKYLAERQATQEDGARVAQPGKIMHETRAGEMAALAEIPFELYYGSIDATPLFVMLAGAYLRRTGNIELIRGLWSNIEAALTWMEQYGDMDGDGFLEYLPDKNGLFNQGWKDSHDSIFHKDGLSPEGPIALCEVQGYYYAAKQEAAFMARRLGKENLAHRFHTEAEMLKEKFDEFFWDKELGSYVLALDGRKRPCRVLASNGGHALYCGIAQPAKAMQMARVLTTEPLFSGWGIRTLAADEVLYNPISYHNGSVWPHDNALIGAGLAAYGFKKEFTQIFAALFEVSAHMEINRLPELFCGFHRRRDLGPTHHPVACSPQSWAAGALPLMLQASLGVSFEPENKTVLFKAPLLPDFLEHIYLRDLVVTGDKTVDLHLRRFGANVAVEVLRRSPDVRVIVIN
jgi:glycogen debranching enzyme